MDATEDLERYGITAMYQYVGEIRHGGQTYIIKTKHYTFTTSLDVGHLHGYQQMLKTDDMSSLNFYKKPDKQEINFSCYFFVGCIA